MRSESRSETGDHDDGERREKTLTSANFSSGAKIENRISLAHDGSQVKNFLLHVVHIARRELERWHD